MAILEFRTMQGVHKERESLSSSLDLHNLRVTKGMEKDKSPTFLEEEEMQKQFPCERMVAPLESDDEWKVGASTSSDDMCKIARGETRIGLKNGLLLPIPKEDSSFESLDLRAAAVLDKSMRALESSTSLTSCAFAMTMDYAHCWEGGGGGWEVEKGKQEDGRTDNLGPSEHLHSCQNKGATKIAGCHGCDSHIARVLKEIINNNNDYGLKLCNLTKTHNNSVDRMLVKDLNNVNSKENTFEEGCLDMAKLQLWNDESSKKRALDCNGQVLPRPASQNDMSTRQASGEVGALAEKMRDATRATAPTLDRLTQTKQTGGLSSCKMLPPRVHRSGDMRPPARAKGELQRKIKSAALQRKKKRSMKSNHGAKDPTHLGQRKLLLPSKSPKWRGLSTALSVMRSICHGPGEVGVVNAQARPLLIIAGKCVFRSTAPLDTPRLSTAPTERQQYVQQACNASRSSPHTVLDKNEKEPFESNDEESFPPPRSAGVSSRYDARKTSSCAQPTSKPRLPPVTRISCSSSTLPGHDKCPATLSSVTYWPPVVTELDNWISQVVNEWLDKDDNVAAMGNRPLTHPLPSVENPVPSSSRGGGCSGEKLGAFCLPPIAEVTEVSNQMSFKSSQNMLEELEKLQKPWTVPSKKLTELDARIQEAQTVSDLSQMLEPISMALMSSVPGSKVAGDIKTSPTSIIQDFGRDDVVQEFQRQILILEQENENLKSSLCKQEHADLFRRLKALDF